jgi:ABC-type dipeptide/oligopeptide/nickel transport system ATPase component/ABC-type dipeptide/oligopeptide/nickel transport system permease subunit
MRVRSLSLATRLGFALLALLILVALVGPVVAGDAADRLTDAAQQGASWAHPLGTDRLGRDLLARTIVAARLTLVMAAAATAIAAVGGILLGTSLSLMRPRAQAVGARFIDLLVAYPAILVAITVIAILAPSATSATVGIGFAFVATFARLTHALARSVAARDYVSVSRLLGTSSWHVLRRHVLPNVAEPLLVLTSVAFSAAVVALSALSFLGLGVQPPSYDWGTMLTDGLASLYTNPIQAVGPAVGIVLTGLTAGLIGDGLASILDPRQAGRSGRAAPAVEPPIAAAEGVAPDVAPTEAVADAGAGGLTVRRLRVARADGLPLVHALDLSIAPGEIVGLVGESGSGKSLTAMAIARLLPSGVGATADTLSLGELDLLDAGADAKLATRVGVVFQDPSSSFNPVLRMATQTTEVVRVHGRLGRAAARRKAVEAFAAVRISDPQRRIGQYPHQLSGGMRQRAMIAAALMLEPDLLIADEPTTALDVTVQADVLELLREANRERGTSILLISHDLAVVAQLCHRVLVMRAGRIVEHLSVDRLRSGEVTHSYTRTLLAATPRIELESRELIG